MNRTFKTFAFRVVSEVKDNLVNKKGFGKKKNCVSSFLLLFLTHEFSESLLSSLCCLVLWFKNQCVLEICSDSKPYVTL